MPARYLHLYPNISKIQYFKKKKEIRKILPKLNSFYFILFYDLELKKNFKGLLFVKGKKGGILRLYLHHACFFRFETQILYFISEG